MPSLTTIAGALVALYASTFVYKFLRNWINGRKTGLPIIAIPWDQDHIIWMVISVPLVPVLKKILPTWIFERTTLSIYGWEFREQLRPWEKIAGPQGNNKTFFLLTAGGAELNTCDPEVAWEIVRRPRDFVQPPINLTIMGRFGHNVLTDNGEQWSRQRKVVASVINERVSKAVFNESIRQTEGMLGEVYDAADTHTAETNKVFDMMKKITINVLSGAGMGQSVSWKNDENEKPREGYKMTYIKACQTVIDAVGGPIVLPAWFLGNYPSFLPGHKFMRDLGQACVEFPLHLKHLLQEEDNRAADKGSETKSNILSQLLEANKGDGKSGRALAEDEMLGNLFIFTAAGFETTTNTLSYALMMLCRYPALQDWMFEEIDAILPNDAGETLDYAAIFPRVVRIMAILFETLRLFVPVIHLCKGTKTAQVIETSKGKINIPPDCLTYVNIVGLHLQPTVWRDLNKSQDDVADVVSIQSAGAQEDEYLFRPSRWINPPGAAQPVFQPPRGSYMPWSAGPRVCPGQKMAQVEFTAIFLTLFRRHRIEAVPSTIDGREETVSEKHVRLDTLMSDSVSILTLSMQGIYDASEKTSDGKGVSVRFTRRK